MMKTLRKRAYFKAMGVRYKRIGNGFRITIPGNKKIAVRSFEPISTYGLIGATTRAVNVMKRKVATIED